MAFTYTMLRVRTTFLWPLVRFEYMMMAPYQSYAKHSEEFTIIGERNGQREEIDLSPYFPVLLGERNIRENLLYRERSLDSTSHVRQELMAKKLLELEAKQGRHYDRLILEWWSWPASPEGYRTLKQKEFADIELLLRYP